MPRPGRLAMWGWFILKNVIGWVLIVAGMPLGWVTPGPLGIIAFLIGFSLITFPGKRRLTARVLHGKPIERGSRAFERSVATFAAVTPLLLLQFLRWNRVPSTTTQDLGTGGVIGGVYLALALAAWFAGLRSLPLLNYLLRWVPRLRRKTRPWLRRHGVDLLPARRRKRPLAEEHSLDDRDEEILVIHERYRNGVVRFWKAARPWVSRVLVVGVTGLIFFKIFQPIVKNWSVVQASVRETSPWKLGASVGMFALFLVGFRAFQWRYILGRFGHWLPAAAAVRIWSSSELARYAPGVIWQVVGRVYLVKPYGVRGSVCSATQVLELTLFLLANIMVAVGCLTWLGIKSFHGPARTWLVAAMCLVPFLLTLLHPSVLYRVLNLVMRKLNKPQVEKRMSFAELLGLVGWSVCGLLFQSLAIWYIVSEPIGGLKLAKWWVIAGSYSLAWVAGFLAFWAPGGLGVRELVLAAALQVALPPQLRERFADPAARLSVLAFLSVLLRLWATLGELLVWSAATLADPRRARPSAPKANASFNAVEAVGVSE